MGTWTLEIDLDWPPDDETRAQWFERLLRRGCRSTAPRERHGQWRPAYAERIVVTVCACEPGWTCPKCRDTPADHRYELDEPEPEEMAELFTEAGRMSTETVTAMSSAAIQAQKAIDAKSSAERQAHALTALVLIVFAYAEQKGLR